MVGIEKNRHEYLLVEPLQKSSSILNKSKHGRQGRGSLLQQMKLSSSSPMIQLLRIQNNFAKLVTV